MLTVSDSSPRRAPHLGPGCVVTQGGHTSLAHLDQTLPPLSSEKLAQLAAHHGTGPASPPAPAPGVNVGEVQALLGLAQTKGVLTDANTRAYIGRAVADPQALLTELQALPNRTPLPATGAPVLPGHAATLAGKPYKELERTREGSAYLKELQRADPPAFERLFRASFDPAVQAPVTQATLAGKPYQELTRTREGSVYLADLRRTDPAAFERLFLDSYDL